MMKKMRTLRKLKSVNDLALAILVLLGFQQAEAQKVVFKTSTCIVSAAVSVTDENENPVHGLGPEYFTPYSYTGKISSTGKAEIEVHPITFFSAETKDEGIDLLLLADVSPSMQNQNGLKKVKASLEQFIPRLRPQDRIKIIPFTTMADLSLPLTSDKKVLLDQVRKLSIVDAHATLIAGSVQTAIEGYLSDADIMKGPPQKRVMVLLSDGEDMGRPDYDRIREIVSKSGFVIHTIELFYRGSNQALSNYSFVTGGTSFVWTVATKNINYLNSVFSSIWKSEISRYHLAFYSERHCSQNTQLWVSVKDPVTGKNNYKIKFSQR